MIAAEIAVANSGCMATDRTAHESQGDQDYEYSSHSTHTFRGNVDRDVIDRIFVTGLLSPTAKSAKIGGLR